MRVPFSASLLGLSFSFLAIVGLCGCDRQAALAEGPASSAEKPHAMPEANGKGAPKHKANRLAKESSPYLLLHAHNPVDWYPWGEEALAKAKKENKLIFLSVGYSSCYWCHVMERESFMDEAIAKYLNEHFVCIKIDREERPDVDEVYMTALQMMGRDGGWPLSMFLTPDAKPFFGGTYFPPRDRPDGLSGFLTVTETVQKVWTEKPKSVQEAADLVAVELKKVLETQAPAATAPATAEALAAAQEGMARHFDKENGGFSSGRSKFPSPSNLLFLLVRVKDGDAPARRMLTKTLDRMAEGGLRDHIGGGFHRYTVDNQWRIPHFEKMLYDNGQLATVYAEAYALTGNAEYRRVAEELCAFVLREMTDAAGGFYAALDAETDAVEGKFYVWTKDEIASALTPAEFERFSAAYGINHPPNFEEDFYVPQLAQSRSELAKASGKSVDALEADLAPMRAKLLAVRAKRKRPLTDTKMLAGWNGLMIRGLADAGRVLKRKEYIDAASRAADFVLKNLRRDGRLLRTHTAGEAKLNAYLEDYVLVADGLIALHRATAEPRWLDEADALTARQIELFWDEKQGGFFFTSDDHEELLVRRKDAYDGPIPSGNGAAVGNLVYLAATGKKERIDIAERAMALLTPRLAESPASHPRAAVSLAELLAAKKKSSQ